MRPDQAKFLLDFLLPQLESEHAVTRKILAAVPPEAIHYQPGPPAMTAYQLSRHLALCELWFLDAILRGEFRDPALPPDSAANCQDLAAWYAESFAARLPQLQQLPPADLAKPIDYIGLRYDPAVAYLNIAIRHSVHHRGQLSAYLRGMGAKVPAIYVESADEPYPPEGESQPVPAPPAF